MQSSCVDLNYDKLLFYKDRSAKFELSLTNHLVYVGKAQVVLPDEPGPEYHQDHPEHNLRKQQRRLTVSEGEYEDGVIGHQGAHSNEQGQSYLSESLPVAIGQK